MATLSIIAQPIDSRLPGPSDIEMFLTVGITALIIINLLPLVGMMALTYTYLPKQRRKSLHQIQCHRCQYFCVNADLKCVLHPTIVLTTRAVNCADYGSKSGVADYKV
jgi:hypothetical protein